MTETQSLYSDSDDSDSEVEDDEYENGNAHDIVDDNDNDNENYETTNNDGVVFVCKKKYTENGDEDENVDGGGYDDDDDDNDDDDEVDNIVGGLVDDEDDEDDEINNKTLQKFNEEMKKNYILDFHPECGVNNYDEIGTLTKLVRDKNGNIIDDLHQTIPYLTKYERTRVLGQRAKQINSGAKAFVNIPENVIDGYLVAEMELMQKRLPFIICRPIPSGGREYWNLKDLEIVSF